MYKFWGLGLGPLWRVIYLATIALQRYPIFAKTGFLGGFVYSFNLPYLFLFKGMHVDSEGNKLLVRLE